jgi:STE24 endopeptidase
MTMNGYAILILATLLLSYILNLVADLLNLRVLQSALPPELEDAYDAAAYRNSQAYTRVQTQFSWISGTFDLALILVFWYTGGFAALDQLVRGWHLGPVLTGVAYIGLLLLGKECLALPFRLYATFGIEARFGFNNTTPATFAADLLKGLGLAIVLVLLC